MCVCMYVCVQCDLFGGQVCLQLSQRRPDDFTSRGPPSRRETEEERDGGIWGEEGRGGSVRTVEKSTSFSICGFY